MKKLHVIQSLGGLFLVLVEPKVLFSVGILGNIFLMIKDTLGALFWNDAYQMGKKTSKKLKVKIFYTKLKKLNAMGQTLFETSLISRDIFEGLDNSID